MHTVHVKKAFTPKGGKYEVGIVECPFCGKDHTHGNKTGHRLAHCIEQTPESNEGYIIIAKETGE